jgi:hypothetical protein
MNEYEIVDLDSMGAEIDGIPVPVIRKLVQFYKHTTHDLDLERVDFYTKNI